MPSIDKLYRELRGSGYEVLLIDVGEDRERVSKVVRDQEYSMPVVVDRAGKAARAYHVVATPTVYLIDPKGVLVGRAVGPRNWDSEEGRRVIQTVLDVRVSRPVATAALQDYPVARLLVTPDWVRRNLNNPKVRLVDLGTRPDYEQGHIKNAVHFDGNKLFALRDGVPGLLPPVERVELAIRTSGIDNDSIVVAYDDQDGLMAARFFWAVDYLGHPDVRLLDGGWQGWVKAGGEVSRETPRVKPGNFTATPGPGKLATAEWISKRLEDPGVRIVDARSLAEYSGEEVMAFRGGHIPGAVNIDWINNLRFGSVKNLKDSGVKTVKSAAELKLIYERAGIMPDKEVVVYCQNLVRSAHTYFTLRLLGYSKVRGYDGSWVEWGNRTDLPVEK